MSRLAALAMRDLADCLDEVAEASTTRADTRDVLAAMAQAHRAAADLIEARAGKLEVPAGYRSGQAGTRETER